MIKKIDMIFLHDLCFFPDTVKTVVKNKAMIRAMRKSPNIMEHSLVYGISQDHRVGIIFGSRMSYILLYFEIFMPHQKIFVPFRQKDEFYLIPRFV